jgi:hypothetical protein
MDDDAVCQALNVDAEKQRLLCTKEEEKLYEMICEG